MGRKLGSLGSVVPFACFAWFAGNISGSFPLGLWRASRVLYFAHHVLFVIRLATRKIQIVGIVPGPEGQWMNQMARNLTDAADGFLLGFR